MAKSEINAEISHRATLLAKPVFFQKKFISGKIIFAEMPAGEGVIHGVAVNPESRNLHCTCPFRPKPCIHALALNALFEREGESAFSSAGELPEWVSALLEGHATFRIPLTFNKQDRVAAKIQRRFERLERVANGFEDLEVWLLDAARRGFATVVSEDPKWYEGIAARMADASMPGLSRTLRLLGQIPSSAPDWADRVAGVFADCYLAVRVFRKRGTLPETLLHDLQSFIGIHVKKEDVLASGEREQDAWAVVGQMEEPLEDKLSVRRTWLLGGKTGRYALLLDYSFGGDGFPPGFEPGTIQQGTLAFYPSAFPQRALVVGDFVTVPKKVEKLPGFADFNAFSQSYAAALAAQPWLSIFPAAFSQVTPQAQGSQFFIVDNSNKALPLHVEGNSGWRLVALSGGRPVGLFGEWDGILFRPLSTVAEGRLVRM